MYSLEQNVHNYVPEKAQPKQIGIIGGNGLMGQLLAREFTKEGYEVFTTGENVAKNLTGRHLRHLNRNLVRQCDVIVLSVPIPDLTKGIEGIIGSNLSRGFRGKLLLDVCSTKVEPIQQMLRVRGPSIIGMHPMFGPAVKDFTGLKVVICPSIGSRFNHVMQSRLDRWTNWIEGFWQRRGAVTVRMDPEEHDKAVPSVQFEVLIAVLAYASVLKATGASFNAMNQIGTPNSRLLMACVGRMLDESMIPTYTNIAFENAHNFGACRAFEDAASHIRQIVASGDRGEFASELRRVAEYVEANGRPELKATAGFLQQALANREKVEAAIQRKN